MCKENIYRLCNIKQLEQDIKSRCNLHFLWNAWNLKCSILYEWHARATNAIQILYTPNDSSDKTPLMCSTIPLCLFASKYDIIGRRLNYNTVSSNKFKYIDM